MKRTVLALAMGLLASLAQAQVVTPSLVWDYAATTPAYVAAGLQTVTVDGVVITAAPACVANGATTTCTQVLPAQQPGPHVYAVTLVAEGVQRSSQITIDPSKGKQPGGIRININVNVQVP